MKKLFALVLSALFVVALSVPGLATDARQIALGYSGNYIEDDYNIFTWYGTLPSYSNTVWIGLDYCGYYLSADGDGMADTYRPYIGASYALGSEGKYGTLAMFFNYMAPPLNSGSWGWDTSGPDDFYIPGWYYDTWSDDPYDNSLTSKWNVLYGYAMEKLSFGLYFSRADESYTMDASKAYNDPAERDTSYTNLEEYAYTTIGAGVRFDMGEKMYADLAFDYSWASMTYDVQNVYDGSDQQEYYAQYGEISADANKMMNFRGRMFYELNETITLVPYASFGMFDYSLQADSMVYFQDRYWDGDGVDTLSWKDTHYGVKGMAFTLGIGANVRVNENNLLLFVVEPYSYMKLEQSDPADGFVRQDDLGDDYYSDPDSWGVTHEETMTTLPLFRLALESDVKDWLTFRIGAVKAFYKEESTMSLKTQYGEFGGDPAYLDYKETATETWSDFGYWMGLGFHVGDFDIDAVINNNLPFRIGYWLTGYGGSGYSDPPVYMLSAAYHF